MQYIVMTFLDENGKKRFVKEKINVSSDKPDWLYSVKDEKGTIGKVNKQWLIANQGNILNLGVDKNNALYYVNPDKSKKEESVKQNKQSRVYGVTLSYTDEHKVRVSNTVMNSIYIMKGGELISIPANCLQFPDGYKLTLPEPFSKLTISTDYALKDAKDDVLEVLEIVGIVHYVYKQDYYRDYHYLIFDETFFNLLKPNFMVDYSAEFVYTWGESYKNGYVIYPSVKYPDLKVVGCLIDVHSVLEDLLKFRNMFLEQCRFGLFYGIEFAKRGEKVLMEYMQNVSVAYMAMLDKFKNFNAYNMKEYYG